MAAKRNSKIKTADGSPTLFDYFQLDSTAAVPESPQIETIKCLSVRQPYADQIFFCGKWAENRSWPTSYRGELWIHASSLERSEKADPAESPTGLLTGHILGRANLVAVLTGDELYSLMPDPALKLHRRKAWQRPVIDESNENVQFCRELLADVDPESWAHFVIESPYVWILADQEMLHDPIPTVGKLRIWNFETTEDRLELASESKTDWRK